MRQWFRKERMGGEKDGKLVKGTTVLEKKKGCVLNYEAMQAMAHVGAPKKPTGDKGHGRSALSAQGIAHCPT